MPPSTNQTARSEFSWLVNVRATVTTTPPSIAPIGIMPQAKNRYTLFTRPSRCGGMIDWRKLTVITFHDEPINIRTANSRAVSGHHELKPTEISTTADDPRVSARHVPLPSFLDSHGAT